MVFERKWRLLNVINFCHYIHAWRTSYIILNAWRYFEKAETSGRLTINYFLYPAIKMFKGNITHMFFKRKTTKTLLNKQETRLIIHTTMCIVNDNLILIIITFSLLVWTSALNNHAIQKKLFLKQRDVVLRIVSAYWTVSKSAVLVLASVPPIDLLVEERKETFQRRKEPPCLTNLQEIARAKEAIRKNGRRRLPRCGFRSAARVGSSGHGCPYSGDQGLVTIVGPTVVVSVLPTLVANTGNQKYARPSAQLWPTLDPTIGPTLAKCFRWPWQFSRPTSGLRLNQS